MTPRVLPLVAAASLALAGCGGSGSEDAGGSGGGDAATQCPPADGSAERVTQFEQAPPMCIDESKDYTATLTTDVGDVELDLLTDKAPKTVNNFVVLARYHFYDGLAFHRVIQGFMAQGGDPSGDGSGGPGYQFDDELPEAGEYEVGSVAMANAGSDTNGSQFFIITGKAGVELPPKYSLFGQVTDGMDVVETIEADGSQGEGSPASVHTIESVTISQE
ncbi:peptidylprolyl isomerase [Janibacter cremeus]|uniref:Peptidyl-prolyl cis-trans isomerase n=1 Tax=Janibacter cremeus TaxID=1285192 RepID=A0A852VM53_9MICO|nr:peptidylprolyl isomerase [Janibacter cremeus]NYF98157.1 cyclophilin family peptidyl-prolyl cis-trans isomerase [Janibacter cremeus]